MSSTDALDYKSIGNWWLVYNMMESLIDDAIGSVTESFGEDSEVKSAIRAALGDTNV